MGIPEGALCDGVEVIVAGGLDYYPGSAQSSPSFSFRATHLRLAGEGDLLARLAELRRRLRADGLFEPQKLLPRRLPPKTIGVITGRDSAAAADLRAGFARCSWGGTVIWAHPPVQDRHAAPRIARALQELAARSEVDVIVVARGGGSLADLWAFCDETLCRTIALLSTPVISAVGHESDRTLIDDVAALACSTPTHAAEVAVGLDVASAGAELRSFAATARRASGSRVRAAARELGSLAGVPARHLSTERDRLRQLLREARASSQRGIERRSRLADRGALVVGRKGAATSAEIRRLSSVVAARGRALGVGARRAVAVRERSVADIGVALRAHEPERTLERGYALVTDRDDEPVTSASRAREAWQVRVRFADDSVAARIEDE